MAAGPGAASTGHGGSRGSSAALEATLDRRFQGVSNTMESIQGLSSWCIENKKHNSLIVRYWMKWLKKSDASHRLNLFYLANDVIQNCKRKNAIVYRTAFSNVLPDAALLVKDGKVRKSVERIFTIWQERNVYPEEFISELKTGLQKKPEAPPPPEAVNPKTALKSKIVAEFTPQVFIEQLAGYKRAQEEADLREKQLAALRLDICSTEALKRLKDKAGGNKFSKDFEEGSTRLQELVAFLEGQMQTGPPLLEALGNADVFYEMQYKEVKIVANAYKTFANRVTNLKRKLDALKATLPDVDDSPIPSPSEDAPSPTGSESPFHGLTGARAAAHAGERGAGERDNRDVEDMDLSEEEESGGVGIIVEERKEKPPSTSVSKAVTATATKTTHAAASKPAPAVVPPIRSLSEPGASQTPPSHPVPAPSTPAPGSVVSPAPLQVNLANVDLGKISSILSTLTNAMKNTGVSPISRTSPDTPSTPSSNASSSKPSTAAPGGGGSAPNPLASILSRVDISPEGILSALTKTQAHGAGLQGLSSLLHSVTGNSSGGVASTPAPRGGAATSSEAPPSSAASSTAAGGKTGVTTAAQTNPTPPKIPKPTAGNNFKRESERERGLEWERVREREREKEREREREAAAAAAAAAMPSLESKINRFLQGNPGFSALGIDDSGSDSPLLVGGDNVDGTPVRDESGGTPTQDEIMDEPSACEPHGKPGSTGGHNLSPTAYRSDPWDAVITPREVEPQTNDRDYRTPSSSSLYPSFGAAAKKLPKALQKAPEQEAMKRKGAGATSSEQKMKAKMEGLGGRASDGLLKSAASRTASEEGREEKGKKSSGGKREAGSIPPNAVGGDGQHYHRIQTVVSSSCGEGAPIQTLGYSNRRLSGERIQTVESIRVIGRGMRRGGGASVRTGGVWYEEEEFMDAPPTGNDIQEVSEELGLVPPPPRHMPPNAHGPPGPGQYPQHPLPYASESPHALPPQLPPSSPFFPSSVPPIPRPPPPPIPQPPPPPRDFLPTQTAVMVGGVLVPIDRVLPYPPSNTRQEGGDRGGLGQNAPPGANRGAKPHVPPPLMTSLLGEPPSFKEGPPRPGTVKEHFTPRHTPPLHRPGAPGVPPPLLGRARDGPSPPPSSASAPSTTANAPPSPSGEPRPLHPPPNRLPAPTKNQRPLASPPAQPRTPRPPPSPLALLRLPNARPPLHSPLPSPVNQRPFLRGPAPQPLRSPTLIREPLLPGGKRPGPGGSFHPPKRPFLPPRY